MVIDDGCKVEANLKVGDASDWIPHGYISSSYVKKSTFLDVLCIPDHGGGETMKVVQITD